MSIPAEKQDSQLMRAMFSAIAPRYDFVTRIFSYGMDMRWKRLGVKKAPLPKRAIVLDLAAGTGDFSRIVLHQFPEARAVAVDLTEEMLRVARASGLSEAACGDASKLPFPDGSFDCVFVGYGLRNFPSLDTALQEIKRVTRPGGWIVSLDFFLPKNRLLKHGYLGYLYAQGAFWGLLLHGRPRTYTYIPDSLRSFLSIEDFSSLLQRSGYGIVNSQSYIFGGIGLHWATNGQCEAAPA